MKKYLLTGLVTLLPLAVTVIVVEFAVNLLTKPFMGIVTPLLSSLPISSEHLIRTISQILILISLWQNEETDELYIAVGNLKVGKAERPSS